MKKTRKILSLALALCLALALLPTAAFAAGQVYHPQTGAELNELLSHDSRLPNGSTVYLEARTYQLSRILFVYQVDDLSIIGQPGTQLILDTGSDTVMDVSNCNNLTLSNLVMGHNERLTYAGCAEGVLGVYSSSATIMDCDLFGCGLYGIDAFGSEITVDHCTIRDCSERAASFTNSKADIKNSTFSGNGYSDKVRADEAFYVNFYDSYPDIMAAR